MSNRRNYKRSQGKIKAAAALRENKRKRRKQEFKQAQSEFENFSNESFFFTGIALYWAEGNKRADRFLFMNSDAEMIRFMITWCMRYFSLEKNAIYVRLHLHGSYAHENCERFWHTKTGIPWSNFMKIVYTPESKKYKKRPEYKGCARLEAV